MQGSVDGRSSFDFFVVGRAPRWHAHDGGAVKASAEPGVYGVGLDVEFTLATDDVLIVEVIPMVSVAPRRVRGARIEVKDRSSSVVACARSSSCSRDST